MATPASQPTTLFNRDFFLLWQGQVVSRLGNQAFLIATTLWTLEVTGSATAMGLMLTANRIATIVLGPFAGAYVDSRPRLRTIVACDFGRGGGDLRACGFLLCVTATRAGGGAVLCDADERGHGGRVQPGRRLHHP